MSTRAEGIAQYALGQIEQWAGAFEADGTPEVIAFHNRVVGFYMAMCERNMTDSQRDRANIAIQILESVGDEICSEES